MKEVGRDLGAVAVLHLRKRMWLVSLFLMGAWQTDHPEVPGDHGSARVVTAVFCWTRTLLSPSNHQQSIRIPHSRYF